MINALYDLIIVLPLAILSVFMAGPYMGMPGDSITGLVAAAVFTIWIISFKHISKKNRLLSFGIVLVFSLGIFFIVGEENREIFISDYKWIIYILLLTLPAIMLGRIAQKWRWVHVIAAAVLLASLLFSLLVGFKIEKACVVLAIFWMLELVAEQIQRGWPKAGYTELKNHIVLSSPVLILLCLIVMWAPAPDKPYNWAIVKNIYNSVALNFKQIAGSLTHPDEEYASVGFGEDKNFFGKISQDYKPVLRIAPDRDTIKNFYLVGTISSEFSNLSWSYGGSEGDNERMFDALETTAAVRKYDDEHYYNYFVKSNLKVTNLLFNTRYAFGLAKPLLEPLKSINPVYKDIGESIRFDKKLKYNETYELTSYVLNYDNPNIADLLCEAEAIEEDEWNRSLKNSDLSSYPQYSYNNYLNYKNSIYDRYGQKPGCSERAKAVLDIIRSNSDNAYDELKNLEALLNSYSYSGEGKFPDSVTDAGSFIDYMLFENREGYCVHFATAFVLMARELGYPCRYVQGYFATRDKEALIEVNRSMAHAWAEVYFDNVGWIAFEPTPGKSGQAGWKIREGYYQTEKNPNYDPSQFLQDEDIPVYDEAELSQSNKGQALLRIMKIVLLPLVLVILFVVIFLTVGKLIAKRRYGRLSQNDKLVYLFNENMRALKKLGYPVEAGETLCEYKKKMSGEMPEMSFEFISAYEELIYSKKVNASSDIACFEDENLKLRKLLKKKRFLVLGNYL